MQRSGQGNAAGSLLACGGWVTGQCSTSNNFLHAEVRTLYYSWFSCRVPLQVHFAFAALRLSPLDLDFLERWVLRVDTGSLPTIGAGGSCASCVWWTGSATICNESCALVRMYLVN